MKTIAVQEAGRQVGNLIAEACRGETMVVTDGDKCVTLAPGAPLDVERDGPELEAEPLKAVNGPHLPMREGELGEIADQAVREHRAKRR